VRLIHVFREANRYADLLANIGCDSIGDIVYFEHHPSEVILIVDDDYKSVSFFPLSFCVIFFSLDLGPLNKKNTTIFLFLWVCVFCKLSNIRLVHFPGEWGVDFSNVVFRLPFQAAHSKINLFTRKTFVIDKFFGILRVCWSSIGISNIYFF
jgi:hypothetical protein